MEKTPRQLQVRSLVTPGALFEQEAQVLECTSVAELEAAFAWAERTGTRLSLLGAQRSFGAQFLPVEGGVAVDVSRLERGAQLLSEEADGRLLVRAGGGTRFCDLHRLFPTHRVLCPPTSDRITLAGALAACVHSANGYFSDSVRAFKLITPSGAAHRCSLGAPGLAGQLFRAVPGSFGALGAATAIEVELHAVEASRCIGVNTTFAGPSADGAYLDALEQARDDPRFSEGSGGLVYGNRGHALVFGHEPLPLDFQPDALQALLTDDDLDEQAFQHGLANRFPRLAERMVTRAYRRGMRRWAPWYGFQFFQRGYDAAHEVLGGGSLRLRVARLFGMDRRVPVLHQSWFFPRSQLRPFLELYWQQLAEYPGLERRFEQQDLVLLPACQWPAHSMGLSGAPIGVLTTSSSLAAQSVEGKERVAAFFRQFSAASFERFPESRVSLCKQVHCAPEILRAMHAPWVELTSGLRGQVDPKGVLLSRHLERLLAEL